MSQLNLIKQHDAGSLMSTDELTFVYPFLASKSIDSKITNELRQFMMNQYLSQIKITNAIKVTTQLSNPRREPKDISNLDRFEKPKVPVATLKLDNSTIDVGLSQINEDVSVDLTKQEYIDKFRNMLVHMVKTEPRFKELNPIVTTLTLENLLTIPMIAASKTIDIANDVLYWVIFAALGQRLPLLSVSNLERIEHALRTIPPDSYSQLMDPNFLETIDKLNAAREKDPAEVARVKTFKSKNVGKYLQQLGDPLGRGLFAFKKVLDVDTWDQQTGIKTSVDTTLSASAVSTLGSQQQVLSNTNALFSSLLSNHVLHLLQSLTHSIVSSDEINVSGMIIDITQEIIDETNNLVNGLFMGMINAIQSQSIKNSDLLFTLLEKSCKSNSKIDSASIITRLDNTSFSIRGDTTQLADFIQLLTEIGVSASSLSNIVAQLIDEISKFNHSETANKTGSSIDPIKSINNYEQKINNIIIDKFAQYKVLDYLNNNKFQVSSNRFAFLTGNKDASTFFTNVTTSISSIIKFLAIHIFYSYFCEYTGELSAEVEVKRQGVMSFPNYCLVVPIEMLRPIYAVLSAHKFKELIHNDNINNDNEFSISNTADFKIVKVISERLGVRNLIVLDGKQIYYKWMFSNNVQRITLSNISSYNKAQDEFLKAY